MKDRRPNLWLKRRAEMYEAIAENGYTSLKNVEFQFADPDAGWVDTTIKFDGKVVAELSLSGVWGTDPVGDLMRWLEDGIGSYEVPHYLHHDGEGLDFVFHFEELMFPPENDDFDYKHYYSTGIFSLFIYDFENEKLIYTLCDTKEFRKKLYKAVHDFADRQKTNKRAVSDWAWYIYDQKVLNRYKEGEKCDEEQDEKLARKMMLKNLRSSKIEKYLKQ